MYISFIFVERWKNVLYMDFYMDFHLIDFPIYLCIKIFFYLLPLPPKKRSNGSSHCFMNKWGKLPGKIEEQKIVEGRISLLWNVSGPRCGSICRCTRVSLSVRLSTLVGRLVFVDDEVTSELNTLTLYRVLVVMRRLHIYICVCIQ